VNYENIFIIAVFDCCRARKDKTEDPVATRGDNDEVEIVAETNLRGQMFSIFGCAAGKQTPADSILSNYILKEGKEQIERTGEFTTLNSLLLR